ncbi:MAG: hypothetical protein HKN85_05695 [Gammaproteobacteria bacterium]|nr:hypothetical protein [Gammaproteobacteria bacterium]
MQVDRFMVNAFFEIKRNAPLELQRKLRISDPEVGQTMVALHLSTNDERTRLLTRAFLMHAGEDWLTKLEPRKWRSKV